MVEKPLQLLSSFNAFGHHIDIQASCQRNDCSYNSCITRVCKNVVNKGFVDLQHIKWQSLQITEGRIASAKIV